MKIGNTELKYGLCLAPMAGYSARAMRLVCREYGAEYSVTEMVSAKAVVFGDRKTHALARIREDEGPVALQLFGSDAETVAEAARVMSSGEDGGVPPVAIDINMGCPVHKIFSNGEGSALMRSPEKIEKIVAVTARAVNLPVTVKLRTGVDKFTKNAVECAKRAESGGAAAICIHGRTRADMYSGEVDIEAIAELKAAVSIPVIANGDITSPELAKRMLDMTGADAIAIGRGAVGNPFIFEEIRATLSGEKYSPPPTELRVEVALRQLRYAIEDVGEETAVLEARKQIALYLHGFRGASLLRQEINTAKTYVEVEVALHRVIS